MMIKNNDMKKSNLFFPKGGRGYLTHHSSFSQNINGANPTNQTVCLGPHFCRKRYRMMNKILTDELKNPERKIINSTRCLNHYPDYETLKKFLHLKIIKFVLLYLMFCFKTRCLSSFYP